MLDIYLIVDLVVVVTLAILGLSVFLKNKQLATNRYFALFVLSVAIWIISNYISNNTSYSPFVAQVANFFVFSFSFAATVFLLGFAINLAQDKRAGQLFRRLVPLFVAVGIISATPLVVAGVELQDQVYAVKFGPALPVYAAGLLSVVVCIFLIIRKNLKRSTSLAKASLRTLLTSFSFSLPALVIVQFILPATTGWFGLTNVGIFPMLIVVFGLYYGVIKHRLFDLRLVIVRSVAYVLTLTIIGTAYGFASYYLTTLIKSANDQAVQELLNIALIIVVVTVYPPMIRSFRRLTNRYFYQDAYEPEDVFRKLNDMLVSSLDMRFLMIESAKIIESAIKPEFAMVGLRDGSSGYRSFSPRKLEFSSADIARVRQLTPQMRDQKVIIADYLEDAKYAQLREIMVRNNVGVIVRLTQNTRSREEGLGYLVLGQKKSGNPYSRQDIRVLDTVGNELTIAAQNVLHYEEIQQFNQVLQGRVDEATRKLRRTNEKLKALDETKDDFISMASHQLRTPLTSVKGYLSMVLEGDAGKLNATQQKMLSQAFTSSQRMVYLIADLLNVSRLRTGKFVIEQSPTNLAVMIEEELAQLVEAAKVRDLQLSYNKPKDFPELPLDETKTRQVVMNFIDNAIYYTPAGGTIRVELQATDRSIELRVIDNGIGVPKAEQHHLFTKFYRAGNARKARPDGTGLGLFMAKKVVIAQGGSLILESKEGEGSTFGFSFPRSKAALAASAPVTIGVKKPPAAKP
jgi:signal transduction histidine kinase